MCGLLYVERMGVEKLVERKKEAMNTEIAVGGLR